MPDANSLRSFSASRGPERADMLKYSYSIYRAYFYDICHCGIIYNAYFCCIVKKVLAILLTFSIMAQGVVNLGLCAYYQFNKNEIIAKFCVNKNKPMMHCNGQCYLGKQLKKAEENEKRQNQSLREKDEVISIYSADTKFSYIPSFSFVSYIGYYIDRQLNSPQIVLDQPPRV